MADESHAKDRLKELREDFEKALGDLKNRESEFRSIQESAAKEGLISLQQSAELRAQSFRFEAQAVQKLGEQYAQLVRGIRGLSKEDVGGFTSRIARQVSETAAQARNAARAVESGRVKEQNDAELRANRALESAAIEHRRVMLQASEAEAREGLVTQQQVIEQERQLLDAEHRVIER